MSDLGVLAREAAPAIGLAFTCNKRYQPYV